MEKGEKSEIILEYLRDGIKAGKWDNSLLPKELELAEKFGVARGTVRRAFDHLVSEKIVVRKKHVGTELCRNANSDNTICSVISASGHFYEDIFSHLQKLTTEAGYVLHFADVSGYDKINMRKSVRRNINSILSLPWVNKFILDGFHYRRIPYAEELLHKNPVFFDYLDAPLTSKFTGVFFDYYECGRLGAEYLLKKGSKYPLLIIGNGPLVVNRYSPEYFAIHKSKKMIDGYSAVLKEAGFDPMLYIFDVPLRKKQIYELLYEIFSGKRSRPDGIFVDSDVALGQVLNIAKECCFMPKYTVGLYNTPWSRGESGYVFSSIGVPPDKCAEALLEQVLKPLEQRENIYIKPYLAER